MIVSVAPFVHMEGKDICAKNVVVGGSVFMEDSVAIARSVVGKEYANMGVADTYAKSAEGKEYASMGDTAIRVRSAGEKEFVNTTANGIFAGIVGAKQYVNTDVSAAFVRSVERKGSVNTVEDETNAKNAGEVRFVFMVGSNIHVGTAVGKVFVSMGVNAASVASVEGGGFVSTAVCVLDAGSVGVAVSVHMVVYAQHAESVEAGVFVSTTSAESPSEKKRTQEYLGCSFEDLKAHLEKDDFHGNPGMSWENYGSLWHVDHIVPIQYRGADGQKPDLETRIARLHFFNLQPMWSEENLRKGNRFVGKPPPIFPGPDSSRLKVCEHGRIRRRCRECGGSGICEHGRQCTHCRDCGGSQICEDDRQRNNCPQCQKDNPVYLARRERERSTVRARYRDDAIFRITQVSRVAVAKRLAAIRAGSFSLSPRKRMHEYLGCSFQDLKAHLETDDFHGNPGMSWENYGSLWHVDYIVPVMFVGPDGRRPDMEILVSRLHFFNLQPMWSEENRRKGNRYIGKPPFSGNSS
uniref:Uncharacterized protein n=1 Tax=Chromera velia CCMP2878 TaxID=1169474 RepID=A0A0G4GJT7_9ALVE|eukprot:Cvel_22226.t1-p1 / transcript=Cvel_22226.t1 / gene=Cvel_22226 / organism=Chromera_velia_CCMP2878 / gene_product=Zinc finger protein 571, putative / transcript_product=Zinc finger protein 571, putative / location=Cvel_scaffold2162:21887-24282(+) / protein_length=521 / sequence_SO=supercontig / SO=protein_coding / is_pseudo=false